MCTEAIKKLHIYEQKRPITRFLYTPTTIRHVNVEKNIEYRSPLNRINNVKFKFNSTSTNIDLKLFGLTSLPELTAKVASIIGFDAIQIMEKLNHKNLPYSLKMLKKSKTNDNEDIKPDKFYKPFYTSTGTQTDSFSCSTCIIRQLRKFQDIGVQIQPFVENCCTQVDQQMITQELQNILGMSSGMLQQQPSLPSQFQQQFYPSNNNVAPMMYNNNYGGHHQVPMSHPSQQSYNPYYSQPVQGQPITGYGQQLTPNPIMPGYGQQPISSASMMHMNNSMMPSTQLAQYPSAKSHPGPRKLPSTSTTGARRNNIIVPQSPAFSNREK